MTDRGDLGVSVPLVPPLYQSSVYTLAGPRRPRPHHATARRPASSTPATPTPTPATWRRELAALEGGKWGVVAGSGMAAISAILLATLQPAGRPHRRQQPPLRPDDAAARQELARFGVQTTFVDVNDLDQVRKALEQPGAAAVRGDDVQPAAARRPTWRLAELAHERGCLFVVDNTFATPVLTRPLELGADLVMESLTKMIGGHSDVTLGVVCGRGEYFAEVTQAVSIWGLSSNPFDCWLAERGLATLPLRLRAASANAAALADWLAEQPGVARVVYPGRPDHPDHAVAGRCCAAASATCSASSWPAAARR